MIEPAEQQQSTLAQTQPGETPAPTTLSPRRRTVGLHLLVLAGFTLLTIVATWPALPQLGGYVIDKGNPALQRVGDGLAGPRAGNRPVAPLRHQYNAPVYGHAGL